MSKMVFLVFLVLFATCLFPVENKSLDIQRVEQRTKIDGNLDEAIYQTLTPSENFFQFHPKNGAKPTFKTQVYSYYDDKNVYFAFKCFDKEPDKLVGDVTPFGQYANNDEVKVYIDTFLDQRTYKVFAVNPKGIKKGEQTVWEAEARITDYGWNAEFKIPFKSLRFPVNEIQDWNVNFERFIFRLNERSYWTNVARDKINVFGDTFGKLEGINNIKGGKNVEIYPYAGYRSSRSGDEKDDKFAYGLDLKYGITSNLTLDFTSSPDYSEVESDPFFYQVEPFEVNLQENRPFYYESSGYFATSFDLFYSRRISDPTLAVKVTGKEKGYSLGALFAKNNREGGPDSYHGVFRLKKDVFKLSHIGIIYSSIEEKGGYNRNAGFDFDFTIKDIYKIGGMVAKSYNKGESKSDNGMYYLKLARQVDEGLNISAEYKRVEPNVSVPAGFITKVDYHIAYLVAFYSFRWENKWLEQFFIETRYTGEKSIRDGVKTENNAYLGIDFITRSRWYLGMSARYGKWRPQIFSPGGSLVWDQKRYDQGTFWCGLSYGGSSVFRFGLNFRMWDDFVWTPDFSATKKGSKTYFNLSTVFKISPQLQLSGDYNRTFYKSDDDTIRFSGHLISSKLNYQISKKLSSFVKFQYDSNLERFLYDFVIGYEPANISKVIFSIKNFSIDRFELFNPDARSIAFKVSYLYRF